MQRYFSNSIKDGYFILSADDMYHITRVMRMHDKEEIEVVYNKIAYLGCLESVNKTFNVKQGIKLPTSIQKIPEIILCIPLLKEAKMDFIIQKATELGVSEIIPIELERSIIKFNKDKMDTKIARWSRIAKEASEQSKRVTIPVIKPVIPINELVKIDALKLVCSTIATDTNLHNLLQNHLTCDRILIVVGPEGGLTNDEEKAFLKMNFNPVRLGNNIYRVETVPIFLLSVINYEYME